MTGLVTGCHDVSGPAPGQDAPPEAPCPSTPSAPAELRYADELARLAENDPHARTPGWNLSLRAVRTFLMGDEAQGIEAKFVGDPTKLERAMVSLAPQRGLLLIGQPGTAKSMLSELLTAAISGDSTLVIQGGAATGEEPIKAGWSYALPINEGP